MITKNVKITSNKVGLIRKVEVDGVPFNCTDIKIEASANAESMTRVSLTFYAVVETEILDFI